MQYAEGSRSEFISVKRDAKNAMRRCFQFIDAKIHKMLEAGPATAAANGLCDVRIEAKNTSALER